MNRLLAAGLQLKPEPLKSAKGQGELGGRELPEATKPQLRVLLCLSRTRAVGFGTFRKYAVPFLGVLIIIRILPFRVLY